MAIVSGIPLTTFKLQICIQSVTFVVFLQAQITVKILNPSFTFFFSNKKVKYNIWDQHGVRVRHKHHSLSNCKRRNNECESCPTGKEFEGALKLEAGISALTPDFVTCCLRVLLREFFEMELKWCLRWNCLDLLRTTTYHYKLTNIKYCHLLLRQRNWIINIREREKEIQSKITSCLSYIVESFDRIAHAYMIMILCGDYTFIKF